MTTRPRKPSNVSPWKPAGAQQRTAKRNAVLLTAARLFNERGYHATSLDDVAERLHVSKPTLYYYVKSKDDILYECVRTALGMMQEGFDEVRLAGGNAADQLIACLRIYTRIITTDFGMCVVRIGEDPLPAPLRNELRHLKAEIDGVFRRLIADGIVDGSLAPCDPKIATFVVAGALSWIGRWYQPGGELDPDQIADQSIALLMSGLQQRSTPAKKTVARKSK